MITKCSKCGLFWDWMQLDRGVCPFCQENDSLIDLKQESEALRGVDDVKI